MAYVSLNDFLLVAGGYRKTRGSGETRLIRANESTRYDPRITRAAAAA